MDSVGAGYTPGGPLAILLSAGIIEEQAIVGRKVGERGEGRGAPQEGTAVSRQDEAVLSSAFLEVKVLRGIVSQCPMAGLGPLSPASSPALVLL